MQMLRGFHVDNNLVCTCSLEVSNIFFRILYHQMAVEEQIGNLADFLYNRRTEGQVRHKLAVHNVDMYPVSSCSFNFFDFISQKSKISR